MPSLTLAALVLALSGQTPSHTMEDLVRRYTTDRDSIAKYYDVPLSKIGLARKEAFEKGTLDDLKKIDFNKLDRAGQVDWILLRTHCESELRDLPVRRKRNEDIAAWLPFAGQIVEFEEARWTLEPIDPEKAAAKIDGIKSAARTQLEKVKADVEKKKIDAPGALRAAKALGSLRETFRVWFDHYNGYKPLFGWWCKKPYDEAAKALEDYAKFLREDAAGQKGEDTDLLVGDPIGRERLENDLKREMLAYTPEELIQVAEKEYAWCEKEMVKASGAMGFGSDWKKALEKTKEDHVAPGEQDDLVMTQGREAVKFVDDHDLVTIEPLCRETWRVNMLTAEQQKNWPFAFYGGQNMSTSYPVPEMDHTTKLMSMRGNNRHFLRAVTHHELIPGHHLQLYMAERYRPYRQVFSTPFFVEGWALHWEMLLWDLDFPQSPEDKVGMLFWRMHRCARIVVSLKFHLGDMSPQQMIDYLVEKVGHERWTATSEVRRYVGDMYSPLYQCAYMIGGLQLRGLYKELVPSKMTPKQFHDAVLHLGSIPMDMARASLTDMKLPPDFSGGKYVKASFDK